LGEALLERESTELAQDEVSSEKIELAPPGGFVHLIRTRNEDNEI
jgi:hypothetical protein